MRPSRHIPKLAVVLALLCWTLATPDRAEAGLKVKVIRGSDRVSSRRHDDSHDRGRIVYPTYRRNDSRDVDHRRRCDTDSRGRVIVNPHRQSSRGHYTTVTDRVRVADGHYTMQYVQPVIETRYDRFGRLYQHVVRPGYYQKVWVPATYRTVSRRVWVPAPRYRPGRSSRHSRSDRGGIQIRFEF